MVWRIPLALLTPSNIESVLITLMANLAESAVVVDASWYEGGNQGKDFVAKRVTLTLTAQGTTANKIEAKTLGLVNINDCSALILSDNSKVYPAAPSADGTFLLIGAGASGAPADVTGTAKLLVRGPALAEY